MGSPIVQVYRLAASRAALLVHSDLHVSQLSRQRYARSVRLARQASMSAPVSDARRSRENCSSQ